ncbi:MAG: helix-turn-helix domain-containing protein [Deltaproteobacteria bacterium]|nr:helix-turn-helix domain-containing protein [Deltaproteobacteria bacterium]
MAKASEYFSSIRTPRSSAMYIRTAYSVVGSSRKSASPRILAKRAGTTASAISRYENADYDRYELQTLRKIAEACGGRLEVVLRGRDDTDRAA